MPTISTLLGLCLASPTVWDTGRKTFTTCSLFTISLVIIFVMFFVSSKFEIGKLPKMSCFFTHKFVFSKQFLAFAHLHLFSIYLK